MGLSTNTYTYSGGSKQFSATFADGYIEQSHVTAYVVGAVDGLGNQVYLNFTWTSESQITVTDSLTVGDEVTVERTVPKDNVLVDLDENGAITREGLSRNNRQALHAVHEVFDGRLENNLISAVNSLLERVNAIDTQVALVEGLAEDTLDYSLAAAQSALDAALVANSAASLLRNTTLLADGSDTYSLEHDLPIGLVFIDGVQQNWDAFAHDQSGREILFSEDVPSGSTIELLYSAGTAAYSLNTFTDRDSLFADTTLSYSNRAVGEVLRTMKEGYSWTVALSVAADYDAIVGGVRLYVNQNDGGVLPLAAFNVTGAATSAAAVDQDAAIGRAFAALNRAGEGTTMHVPDGFFKITGNKEITADTVTVTGAGSFVLSDASSYMGITVSGEGVVWDGPSVEGDGSFYDGTIPASEDTRQALLLVEGDHFMMRSGKISEPYLCGIRVNATDAFYLGEGVVLEGGPTTMQSTYAHHCRLYQCTNFWVNNPISRADAEGGKPEEGIMCSGGEVGPGLITVRSEASWDHSVYAIGVANLTVTNCNTVSDNAGIVVGSPSFLTAPDNVSIVTGNRSYASTTPVGGSGMHLRNPVNMIVSKNYVDGFDRSYYYSPAGTDDAALEMENVTDTDNIARNWTETGMMVASAGLSTSKIGKMTVTNFDSEPASTGISTVDGEGAHVKAFGNAGVVGNITFDKPRMRGGRYFFNLLRADDVTIIEPDCEGATVKGIEANDSDRLKVRGGKLLNPGVTGVHLLGGCAYPEFTAVHIEDDAGVMLYAFDGDNVTVKGRFLDNVIKGSSSTAFLQMHQAGNGSDYRGNRFGEDPLSGTVTLSAALTTTVANDNIVKGTTFFSVVRLTPLDATAAALVGGANSPYVRNTDHTTGVEFKIRGAGAAAGTEQFHYEILG